MGSIAFDRIADRYDETRGGTERGRRFAATLDAHLECGSTVLEIGVGTGLVAAPLTGRGHAVVGVDLSRPMLERARGRAVPVVVGDATRLPFAHRCVDAVVAVWAVHVIGDLDALMGELTRVTRPAGPLLVVSSTPDVESNDLTDVAQQLTPALGRGWDRSLHLAPRLAAHGYAHETDVRTDVYEFTESPEARAAAIERRDWSSLWDLDEATWASVVQPVIDALRALPDPDRPRRCVHRHVLSVYRRIDRSRPGV